MSETRLKPCPFCGGEAEIERYGTPHVSTIYRCTVCSCSLETGEEWGHATRWNERAVESALRSDLSRMREALQSARAAILDAVLAHVPNDAEWHTKHAATFQAALDSESAMNNVDRGDLYGARAALSPAEKGEA